MSRRHSVFKTVVGLAAAAGAAKVGYDQYKKTKEKFERQEQESESELIRKYNTIFERRVVEADEETFQGCEINAVGAHFILDLGKSVFTKDVYISLSAKASSVKIILPQNVGAQCDITRTASVVQNFAEDTAEEYDCRIFVIGDAIGSRIEVIPMSFYADDDFDEEDEQKTEEAASLQEQKADEPETAASEAKEAREDDAPETKGTEEGEEIPISGDSGDDLEVDEVDKD
jgi:hypothetical protein